MKEMIIDAIKSKAFELLESTAEEHEIQHMVEGLNLKPYHKLLFCHDSDVGREYASHIPTLILDTSSSQVLMVCKEGNLADLADFPTLFTFEVYGWLRNAINNIDEDNRKFGEFLRSVLPPDFVAKMRK